MESIKENNIFLPDINCIYSIKIAEHLIKIGFKINLLGIRKNNTDKIYKKKIKELIATSKSKVIIQENFFYPSENFEKSSKKDFSWVSLKSFEKISYYEKLFILSLDRNSFFPISNLKCTRLFYNIFSYFHKELKSNNINSIVLFGTPHGYYSIVLWAVAEYLGIKIIYTEGSGISPMFSTIETTIDIKRTYEGKYSDLGVLSNLNHEEVEKIVKEESLADYVVKNCYVRKNPTLNINKLFIKKILALCTKHLFLTYQTQELFLLDKPTRGYRFIFPLIKYYFSIIKAEKFLSNISLKKIPIKKDKKILSLFLHQQPESSTMPLAGIFADQLLAFNIISEALPSDYQILIKEHPYFYVDGGEERHERSIDFFSHMIQDKRVSFISKSVNSQNLIQNSKYVVSIAGTVGWQALCIGKPCIVFGNTWFSQCNSCYKVDSVDSLKNAFKAISNLKKVTVEKDVNNFLSSYTKRLIYAPPNQQSFNEGSELMESFKLNTSLKSLGNAIKISLTNKL